ncbi:MAG: hypothetical protein JNJ77_09035 [Planctomycetia bacterium]|nr:hypothetical protein [Planctomycetia bacterium]
MSAHLSPAVAFLSWMLMTGCTEALQNEPRQTLPPGKTEPDIVKELIDDAEQALQSGKSISVLLSDDKYMPAHAWPRFRHLIRDHAKPGTVTMVTEKEPGEKFLFEGVVKDVQGQPISGALIYLYHTSAKGWYSDKAAHITGNGGDFQHARLFTYLKTDDKGRYSFRSIRPASYPQTDLPQHVHVAISKPGILQELLHTEIQFEDDPMLTAEKRKDSVRHGCVVVKPVKQKDGVFHVQADFKVGR